MKVRKYLKVFHTSLYVVNSKRSMVGWGLYVNLKAFHASFIDATQPGFGPSSLLTPFSKCERIFMRFTCSNKWAGSLKRALAVEFYRSFRIFTVHIQSSFFVL